VSFGLIALVGIYLISRAGSILAEGVRLWRHEAGHVHLNHEDHVHGEACGCRHLPTVEEIDTAGSRRAAVGVILAIGLRPCSGAVVVLILASAMGLVWHGALAVLVMSLGTALTIVTLAILATKAREWANTVVAHRSPLWALAGGAVGTLGGALLVLLGLLLLSASFATGTALAL
jgi:ABC-type nickel/cobalt efflux system permease component RcnA